MGQVLIETLPGSPEGPKHRSGGHRNKEHSQWIWHCPDMAFWWQGRSYPLHGQPDWANAYELCPNTPTSCAHSSMSDTPLMATHTHKCSKTPQRPWIKKTTHFLSPKAQGKLLFHIHSDNQAKSLQQRHFQKRLCIVWWWKEMKSYRGRWKEWQ